jgi:hypothetical protein
VNKNPFAVLSKCITQRLVIGCCDRLLYVMTTHTDKNEKHRRNDSTIIQIKSGQRVTVMLIVKQFTFDRSHERYVRFNDTIEAGLNESCEHNIMKIIDND